MEIILLITQIVTLIALIIYVFKTWQIAAATQDATSVSSQILQEMKDSRDQEIAPYIIVYFDMPEGQNIINLIIKNIGKSPATSVNLNFVPKLIGNRNEDFSELAFIKDGIVFLAPGQQIKTFVDSTVGFFNEESYRTLKYKVNVTYYGGLKNIQRFSEHILDMNVFKGVSWITRHDIHKLATDVEKISKSIEQVNRVLSELNDNFSSGIHLSNPLFLTSLIHPDGTNWVQMIIAKLLEFKHLWSTLYDGNTGKLYQPFLGKLKNRLNQIADQLLVIIASCPPKTNSDIRNALLNIASKLADLDAIQFYIDGGKSVADFSSRGDKIFKSVNEIITQLNGLAEDEIKIVEQS